MESTAENVANPEEQIEDLSKMGDASFKEEVAEVTEISETNEAIESLKRESVIQNSATTEQIQEIPENLTLDNSYSVEKSEDVPDSAISDENVTSGELAVEESVNSETVGATENAPIVIEDNESVNSDKSITLPLADEESTCSKFNESTEAVDGSTASEHSDEFLKETDPLIIEENETLESSAGPPVLEETTDGTLETAVINGMPVLYKEEAVENHENRESQAESVVPTLINEAETIEVIREEASESLPEVEEIRSDMVKEVVIPPHILGRNIDRPMSEEFIRNGKVRKPRLGVKIPNRNLTSQIVSGKEIEEEVMERSRLRNASADFPSGGDIFFAKRLTQRLAKKLTAKPSSSKTVATTSHESTDVKPFLHSPSKINDNSDLIALLEGDDDIDWTPTESRKLQEKRTPEWERETALKQLRELPKGKSSSRTPCSKSVSSKSTESLDDSIDDSTHVTDDNSEPKFSMGLVTKTYTRKRNSSSDIKLITASIHQSQKKLHVDREKSSSTSPQSPTKQAEKSTSQKDSSKSPSKSYKSKHATPSPEKKEMPILKKESPIVNQSKSATPKVEPSPISAEKSQPQVIITKTVTLVQPKDPEPTPPAKPPLSPNTYISKSSRIVKKKKIWDPDEDNTPIYFKSPALKSPKIVEAAEKKAEKAVEKKIEKAAEKKVESPQVDKPAVLKPSNDRAVIKKTKLKKALKKKKPKRLTEIDRLLMDEGAVNLLAALKNTEEIQSVNKKKASKSVISLDRAQRELLHKTNEIKNDLQINSAKDSPISLRKKESGAKISPAKEMAAAILTRKKSTGSTHSPPASPAFYNQHAEASRIIRRHSSSSFSSENADDEDDSERSSKRSSEPQRKKMRTHSERHSSSIGVDKQLLSEEMAKNFNNAILVEPKYTQFETFNVRIHEKFIQIILSPTGPQGTTAMSIQTLTELTTVLNIIKDNKDCRAVLISSSGSAFCQGIDYKELASGSKSECQNMAEIYAKCVKTYLMTVSNFPKLLVAGVHGHTIGLGVTMLPLFDMVLASDSATFSTPYSTLGCAAEGGVLFTLPYVMHSALASELFYASRKLTAGEAFRLGLVTRTLWPDKFQEELITSLNAISEQSLQSMKAIKKQLRRQPTSNIDKALEAESSILIQHWTSTECQSNFHDYTIERKPFLT